MNNSQNSYCRLCAELKPINKQVNLFSDSEEQREIMEKLMRINATIEFIDSNLPRTVCLCCVNSLNISAEFVLKIEHAQNILISLFSQNVKIECCSEEEDPFVRDEIPLDIIKIENNQCLPDESRIVLADLSSDVQMKTESYTDFANESKVTKSPKKTKKKRPILVPEAYTPTKSWQDYNWRCSLCDTLFPTIGELQTHSLAAHNTCNPYKCTECNFRKGSLDKFIVHVRSHFQDFKFSCYRCLAKFNTIYETRMHGKSHKESEYFCPGCKTSFADDSQRKEHMDKHFKLNKRIFTSGLTCLKCSTSFATRGLLVSHIRFIHTSKQEYVCHVCGKGFQEKSALTVHITSHTDERPYKCKVCKESFKTERTLKDHFGRHYSSKPFDCDQCNSSFRLKKHLSKHRAIHSEKFPYQCNFCNKRFQRKPYLTNHERLHTGEKPYSCEICKHKFSNWPNYNKHMKQKHDIDTSKKKPLQLS